MSWTSMRPEDPEGQAQLARGYSLLRRDGTREPIPPYRVEGLAAVAGLVSTVDDLARFAAWQLQTLNGGMSPVLGASALASMHLYQRPLGSEALVIPWQGSLAVVSLPTPNPLSSMELFEHVESGRFREAGQFSQWRVHDIA